MIKLEIVTPAKKVYSDEVDQVSIPTPQGEITVLPHHLPVVAQVKPGELKVKKNDKISYLVTGTGFVEITGNSVSIMTDLAQWSEDIDEKAAEEARTRAEVALKQKHTLTNEQFAQTAAALETALASLKVKRRHRKI